jgi:adenosylhomocysteine nucleosidase
MLLQRLSRWLIIRSITVDRSASPYRTPVLAPADVVPRVLVLSAFAPEMKHLLAATTITQRYVINNRTYTTGILAGNEVVLTQSGVSMVNAALVTQTALDHFKVTVIVFSGVAGGVNPDLKPGDVVIPAQWGEYQEQVFTRQKGNTWDIGWHSDEFGNFDMMFPQSAIVPNPTGTFDQEELRFWFPVDPTMLAIARQAAETVTLKCNTLFPLRLPTQPTIKIGGNGISGPTFVENAAYRDWLWQTFAADVVDMESAAVGHVAYVNRVPYLVVRSVSDQADGGTGLTSQIAFFQAAAQNSAAVVSAFLKIWGYEAAKNAKEREEERREEEQKVRTSVLLLLFAVLRVLRG